MHVSFSLRFCLFVFGLVSTTPGYLCIYICRERHDSMIFSVPTNLNMSRNALGKRNMWISWASATILYTPVHQLCADMHRYALYLILCIYIYGCGSKCKVWIKPLSHTRSRPPIQTSDPDLSKGFDPDLWSRPLEWYNVLVSWCLVQWWLHVIGFPALQLFTLPSSQATNCCKATLPSCHASKLHLS